jgi:hypothetical protein
MAGLSAIASPISNLESNQSPYTLLTLPLEIRKKIYEYVFGETELMVEGLAGPWAEGDRPGVVYEKANRFVTVVCKQMREEAVPFFLATTLIVVRDNPKVKAVRHFPQPQFNTFAKPTRVKLRFGLVPHNPKPCSGLRWPSLESFTNLNTLLIDTCDLPVSSGQGATRRRPILRKQRRALCQGHFPAGRRARVRACLWTCKNC